MAARLAAICWAVCTTGATRARTAANSREVATSPQAARRPYARASRYDATCGRAFRAIRFAFRIKALRSRAGRSAWTVEKVGGWRALCANS